MAKVRLEDLMVEDPDAPGQWVLSGKRQPTVYGCYSVIRSVRGGNFFRDALLWNGGYWVTHAGGVCSSVKAWYERTADDWPEEDEEEDGETSFAEPPGAAAEDFWDDWWPLKG